MIHVLRHRVSKNITYDYVFLLVQKFFPLIYELRYKIYIEKVLQKTIRMGR